MTDQADPFRDEAQRESDPPSTDRSPFSPPAPDEAVSDQPSTNQSVFDEPWMRAQHSVMRAESQAELVPGAQLHGSEVDPENSVWDEPGLTPELSGDVPEDGVTWFRWYQQHAAGTTHVKTWLVTILVAFSSGTLAVLGTLVSQPDWQGQFVMVVIGAPLLEEIMKVAVAIWVVEKRPWLFQNGTQILLCGVAAGIVFAALENVLYLNFYIRNPEPWVVSWRWSVCMLLHTSCSAVASLGVIRVWKLFQQKQQRPQLSHGARWIMTAIIIHGTYNFCVTMASIAGYGF